MNKQHEERFPGRIWITNPDTDFLRMQNLGPQHEWLHLTEHQHILAEKEKRIERLREATNSALKSIGWFMQDGNIERLEDEAKLLRAALQEETK